MCRTLLRQVLVWCSSTKRISSDSSAVTIKSSPGLARAWQPEHVCLLAVFSLTVHPSKTIVATGQATASPSDLVGCLCPSMLLGISLWSPTVFDLRLGHQQRDATCGNSLAREWHFGALLLPRFCVACCLIHASLLGRWRNADIGWQRRGSLTRGLGLVEQENHRELERVALACVHYSLQSVHLDCGRSSSERIRVHHLRQGLSVVESSASSERMVAAG